MAHERPNAFDFWGPQTLVGPELKAGDAAPDFTLIRAGNETLSSGELAGKPLVISVIPSIDTGVCSRQTRRFNEEAARLGDAVTILTVSADLPFTQARWCGAEGIDKVVMASDHKDMSFGDAFGTHVKELRFESRAAFVVDKDGVIRYAEYVPNAGQEPNYEAVLATLKTLT
jgi:thioredoxin-dependent peroxiredoxin